MARMTSWGWTATLAVAVLAGCGGSRAADPVTGGQESLLDRTIAQSQTLPGLEFSMTQGSSLQARPASDLTGRDTEARFVPGAAAPEMTGAIAVGTAGTLQGSLGTFTLEIDENLNGTISMPRSAQAQGDHFLLGVGQFFGPRFIEPMSIVRNSNGTINVNVRFKHPIPVPPNQTPPPTATKRLDLHVFNLWAGIVVPGSQTFFAGASPVTTNTRSLTNADTYRRVAPLVNLPGGSGQVLPGKWVVDPSGQNLESGNYNPNADGWLGLNLNNPRGFGVFPQGSSADTTFTLDPGGNGGPISLDFVLLADYQDPRAGTTVDEKIANRLPDPFDTKKLRYILPWAAGDIQRIGATMSGSLPIDNSGSASVNVEIVDFDADFGTTGTFPNDFDLSLMPRASGIASVTGSFPALDSAVLTGTEGVSGNGFPANPKRYSISLTNNLSAPEGTYHGLVRVVDEESGNTAGEPYFQLDPNLLPIATQIPIEAYQAVRAIVSTGISGPKAINFEGDEGDPSFVFGDGAGGFNPWPLPDPGAAIGGLSFDDVLGIPIMAFEGANFFGDAARYGRGVWHVLRPEPGMLSVTGFGFQNAATAINPLAVRAQPLTSFSVSRAYAQPIFSPNARGIWGWADMLTEGLDPATTNHGRGLVVMFEDFHTWFNDPATWGAGPTFRAYYSDLTAAAAPEVNPAHVGATHQTLIADLADVDYQRPPGTPRTAFDNDLIVVQGLKGPFNPTTLTSPTVTQVLPYLDYDDPVSMDPEVYGTYRWAGPTANSQNRPALMGAGLGKINPATTVGVDVANDADRIYICDSADNSVEAWKGLADGIDQPLGGDSYDDEFQYLNLATAPGAITNPIDITTIGDGEGGTLVIVLDRGGNNGFYRLVALDGITLEVVGTRELDQDITEGALSLAADESLANGLDATAFAVLWNDPAGTNPNVGPVGGMFWYTVADA